ncbi:SulP family inorganic anion transporter [Paracraurococcus lichenis]|uniref:SulP family inorganic anion transporter n=1 Tax=Paracraurococcus lichenis TaxID=3064888 RepID=A0ABT9EDF1_9PROT|nr:SulP family inorganic anion transporter [Paracraurococcus sp. LOR1-02]MDO9714257.1 SulP family inorganic anion transporter [Paracraurococcus sp. LOR1-02]
MTIRLPSRAALARDLPASVVVFLVALPLCMGIAMASGVPAAKGLITGVIGGLVVGMLAGSPLQVSGPAAGLAVIVFELVREHGLAALGPILLLAGLIQFLAGLARLGAWFRAVAPAVVYGMLAAIGLLIAASQFHVMFDVAPKPSGLANIAALPGTLLSALLEGNSASVMAAALAALTIMASLVWEKLRPAALRPLPGALVGVAAATAVAALLALPVKRIVLPDTLAEAVDWITPETLSRLLEPDIFLAAFAIAFVASAETLLSAAAVDRMHNGPRSDFDRELAAQGVGNMLCGALGALPMTGVIVRSSANVQAGAATRLSAVLHGAWILLFLLAFPSVLRLVPTASLGGVLVLTGLKLVEPKHLRGLARHGAGAVATYAVTVAAIVATDLLTGVLAGLALSVALVVWKTSHLRAELHEQGGTEARLSLHGAATFVRLPQLEKVLHQIPANTRVQLDAERLAYIDHACLDLLRDWERSRTKMGATPSIDWDGLHRRAGVAGPA